MTKLESFFHANVVWLRVVLFGLAAELIVALAIAKSGPLSDGLAVAAVFVLIVVDLVSRGKRNVAIRTAAVSLLLALLTIIRWKDGHITRALIYGAFSVMFGVIAWGEFDAKKRREE